MFRRGRVYEGLLTYCEDYNLVPRPGFYALRADGRTLRWPRVRLVWIDDAPFDPDDGAGHYEHAGRKDPVQIDRRIVALQAEAQGASGIEAGIRRKPGLSLRYLLRGRRAAR